MESYSHDDDGNMIARSQAGVTTNYDWNTLNKLRQVKVAGAVVESTSYDHGGIRRLKKDGSGATKSYSSGALSLCDTRPAGPVSFIQGHQLLGLEESGNLYYFISDGLSSVRVVVDSSGNAVGEFKYDEFGRQESSTVSAELSGHSYVGGLGVRNDGDSSGLLYMRQRYYDPQLGRFLNQDPIGFAGGLNLFGYVNQNPTNGVDPEGLAWPGWDNKYAVKAAKLIGGFTTGVGRTCMATAENPNTWRLVRSGGALAGGIAAAPELIAGAVTGYLIDQTVGSTWRYFTSYPTAPGTILGGPNPTLSVPEGMLPVSGITQREIYAGKGAKGRNAGRKIEKGNLDRLCEKYMVKDRDGWAKVFGNQDFEGLGGIETGEIHYYTHPQVRGKVEPTHLDR